MRLKTSFIIMAFAAAFFITATAQAAPYYYVTDIGDINGAGYTDGTSINNNGDVTGRAKSSASNSYYEAFLYTNGQVNSIGWLTGVTSLSSNVSMGFDINDSGQIAGYSKSVANKTHAMLYDGWSVNTSGTFVPGTMTDLLTLTYGGTTATYSYGQGINESGAVVGWSTIGYNKGFLAESPGYVMQYIGTLSDRDLSVGYKINDSGQIAGYSYAKLGESSYSYRPFIRETDGTMTNLGTLGGDTSSMGYDLNNSGQVVGYSYLSEEDGGHKQGFIWDASTGMTPIGALAGETTSEAKAINDNGDVVGFSGNKACLYHSDSGTLNDLNQRIDPSLGYNFTSAVDINDNGQVLCVGTNGSTARATFILTEALPGDATLDGPVNLADLGTLIDNYGTTSGATWMMGDFTDDGAVNLADLGILIDNYGATGQLTTEAYHMLAAAGLTVPEPSSFVLLAIGLAGALGYWRRKRR